MHWSMPRSVRASQDLELVLEGAGLDDAVHAALLGRAPAFPPPAPGARIGARFDGPRARGATNALIALVVKWVVRHIVGAHVLPDFFLGPIGQGAHLDDPAVVVIQLDLANVRA